MKKRIKFRTREALLLLWPSLLLGLGCGYHRFFSSPEVFGQFLVGALFLAVGFWGIHWLLNLIQHQGDEFLLPLGAMLTFLGFIFLFRLDMQLARQQVLWCGLALVGLIMVIISLKEYSKLLDYPYLLFSLGLLALALTILAGISAGGAKRWLALGSIRFQPVEPFKLLMITYLAAILSERKELMVQGFWRVSWGPLLLTVSLGLVLLAVQKDLGSALIMVASFLAMVYLATGRWRYFLLGGALFFLGSIPLYYLYPHLRTRIAIWLDPWADSSGAGYQILQSLFALATGGVVGTGWGLGSPQFIPAVATDFIFSSIGEEMGLLGSVGVILLYLLLAVRGFRIAMGCPEEGGGLLAGGLTFLFAFQAFIIIAGVTKLLPLTGVTLPFVSYGGSSLITSYIALALLLNISNAQREGG
ncbi:MAG TPA: FtsW/RodA/SpoVE family cell cycle protein [Moorella mulderi]|nr:FtsW/RodA/SpoVE family cell cycle protein [Moorella mulderi]